MKQIINDHNEDEQLGKKGWLCERCNAVLSPDVKVCPKCESKITEQNKNNKDILLG